MKKNILFILLLFIPIFSFSQTKYIVLDPGHQWDNTTGVLYPARTMTEVQTNLAVAQKLEQIIDWDSNIDWDVILTREDNYSGTNVSLPARELIANNLEFLYEGQVYFLSIHCNGGGGTGTETFYCNQGFSSDDDLLQKYANNIQNNMVEIGVWKDRRCVEDATYFCSTCQCNGHLCVLDNLTMPNCLNEIGFVDTNEDMMKLINDGWQWSFAKAYFEGFKASFSNLELLSVNVANLPCYANGEYLCKISVTVKNTKNEAFSGDVKAILRDFPMNVYDDPSSEFCQLGSNQTVYISAQSEKTLTFTSNIPLTYDVGKALCIESKKYNVFDWTNVPSTSHNKVIRIPLNGAKISGTVYGNSYNPLQGAEIWSYPRPSYKSSEQIKSSSIIFDPLKAATNSLGEYEILVPNDWGEGVISISNHVYYDEKLVSPIENKIFAHNYTTSPVSYGIGCGYGGATGYEGTDPENPIKIHGWLNKFNGLTINGLKDIICLGKNDQIKFGVEPVYFTKIKPFGSSSLLVYYKLINARIFHTGGLNRPGTSGPSYKYYISFVKLDKDLNVVQEEIGKWYTKNVSNSDTPILIGDIDVNEAIRDLGIVGGLYRVKLAQDISSAYSPPGELPGWVELQSIFYLIPDDLVFNNNIASGTYFGRDILVENSTVNSNVNITATNRIAIKKNSRFTGPFRAAIDVEYNSYCNNSSKSSDQIKGKEPLKNSVLSSIDYDRTRGAAPNRTVSELSDNCSCEKNMLLGNEELLKAEGIQVFPSPASVDLNIIIDNNDQSQIEIYNLEGKLIKIFQTQEDENIIDVTNYQNGIYIIKIIKPEKTFVAKFMKTK